MSSYSVPRGMRDFYPDDMARRTKLFDAWRLAAENFGFAAYDSCVVETLDLLKRKGGEEITEQIYAFQDKSGRDLALRPEMTPTLARMIVAKQGSLALPVKWTTIAQCFRYERMTKGRRREHYQWNLDIVGEPSVSAEAEVVATALSAMRSLGVTSDIARVFYSSRRLLSEVLATLEVPDSDHAHIFLALDKRGKVPDEKIHELVAAAGITEDSLGKLFTVMSMTSLEQVTDMLPADSPALSELSAFRHLMALHGVADQIEFDISVIRGLGYYTGIVFECFDTERKGRAIFGGGRYENLLSDLGGKPTPAVGIGFGDVVITDLLDEHGLMGSAPPQDITIGYMDAAQRDLATNVATSFRTQGRRVDLALHAEKAKHFFSRIGKGQASYAIYIGPDDIDNGTIRMKNLSAREEESLLLSDLLGS